MLILFVQSSRKDLLGGNPYGEIGKGAGGEAGRSRRSDPEAEREKEGCQEEASWTPVQFGEKTEAAGESSSQCARQREAQVSQSWAGSSPWEAGLGAEGALDLPAQQLGPLVTQEGQRSVSLKVNEFL